MTPTARLLSSLALVALLVPGADAAPPQGAVASGLRWVHQAPNAEPWIPESVAFSADGERVWAAGNHGNPRLIEPPAAGSGLAVPRHVLSVGSATRLTAVTSSQGSGELALVRRPQPGGGWRVEVSRFEASRTPAAQPLTPSWTHDSGASSSGTSLLRVDRGARTAWVAVHDGAPGEVRLERLARQGGALLASFTLALGGLDALEISADGETVVVAGGAQLRVVEGGLLVHSEALAAATRGVALSADGRRIAVGGFGTLSVLERDAAGSWTTVDTIFGAAEELVLLAGWSPDADTLAIGWWNWMTGRALRCELRDGDDGALLAAWSPTPPSAGTLQNLPQALAFSRDGRRVAFGTWGDGTAPEVCLLERGSALPIATWDLPGSVLDLDLDPSGTRVVVAMKSVHANQFGTTGELRLYDTGERDLVQVAPTAADGSLTVAAARPGASFVAFLCGRAPRLAPAPFASGALGLSRSEPMSIVVRPADLQGRAVATLAPPVLAGGARLGVQALFRTAAGPELSRARLLPALP